MGGGVGGGAGRGRAVQVDPIKPTLKAPGTKRLKLKCDEPLSNFAFNFNLRRYNLVTADDFGRGLHSSPFQLNLSRFGHTTPCPPV